jgi:hypothetical protein
VGKTTVQKIPKIAIQEPVPQRLLDRMKVVTKLIAAGDESTTIESDDLIQFEGLWDCVGGLTADGRFFFTFFPGEEGDDTQWMLELSESQIEAIANGIATSLDLWRCPRCGGADRFSQKDGYCRKCDRP